MKRKIPDGIHYKMWARIHGLEIQKRQCGSCGIMLETTEPFWIKGWVGLKSASHACSPTYDLQLLAAETKEAREEWKKFHSEFVKIIESEAT